VNEKIIRHHARTPLSLIQTLSYKRINKTQRREKKEDLKYLKAWEFGAQSRRRGSRGVRFGGFILRVEEIFYLFLRESVQRKFALFALSLPLVSVFLHQHERAFRVCVCVREKGEDTERKEHVWREGSK
jgi:hypothetical protein